MKYMMIIGAEDKDLVEGELSEAIERLREDGDTRNSRLADRLEALRLVEVPEGTPADADQASEAVSGSPLLAEIIHASMNQTAATQQALIDATQWELDQANAERDLVNARMNELLSGDFMPMPRAIINALYPSVERIIAEARRYRQERETRSAR